MLKRDSIVGILGGKGPEATNILFQLIIKNTPIQAEEDHLRIIIDNNPWIPKPALGITGEGENPIPALVDTARNIERAGADFIIIACNSAHYYIDEIQKALNIPILNIIDETVSAVKKSSFKRIGILATTGLINSNLYQSKFEAGGILALTPKEDDQYNLMNSILQFKNTGQKKELKNNVNRICRYFIQQGSEGIVIACTDIPVVFESQKLKTPYFDTLEILARAAVRDAKKTD